MVVMRSFLVQTLCELEDAPDVSIDETLEGFEVKGPDYQLDVTEKPAGYSFINERVEITMEKNSKAIVCYEVKNGYMPQQLEFLRQSQTMVAKELLSKLSTQPSALALTEDIADAIRLVEEHIKYKK